MDMPNIDKTFNIYQFFSDYGKVNELDEELLTCSDSLNIEESCLIHIASLLNNQNDILSEIATELRKTRLHDNSD